MKAEKNILFITQWKFADALVQTYTLPYVNLIKEQSVFKSLYLIVLNGKLSKVNVFEHNGINVIELPYENVSFATVYPILKKLNAIIKEHNITNLHPWCTTAGAIGFLLKKCWNSKLYLVIDSFEPHAEAMVENGEWKDSSLKYRILVYLEKQQAKHADHLIFVASGMDKYVERKYKVIPKNNFIKPACVDVEKFGVEKQQIDQFKNENGLINKRICVYAGKFGGIYLDEEIFEFVKTAYDFYGDKFRFLLLSNIDDKHLNERLKKFKIPLSVVVKKFVPHEKVALHLLMADFAICPVKPVPSKRYCSPIKDGEYWASGLPVIITKNISDDSEIIEKSNSGYVLKELSTSEYRNAIQHIEELLEKENSIEIKKRIRQLAVTYRDFSIAKNVYTKIYG